MTACSKEEQRINLPESMKKVQRSAQAKQQKKGKRGKAAASKPAEGRYESLSEGSDEGVASMHKTLHDACLAVSARVSRSCAASRPGASTPAVLRNGRCDCCRGHVACWQPLPVLLTCSTSAEDSDDEDEAGEDGREDGDTHDKDMADKADGMGTAADEDVVISSDEEAPVPAAIAPEPVKVSTPVHGVRLVWS